MEVDFERAYWEGVDNSSKLALRAIRNLIDYLEVAKRELCLESAKLSNGDALKFVGPATEVAVAGLVHAIKFLSICRTSLKEANVTLAKRQLIQFDMD